MARNRLVYALSEVTVVVATDLESGGTWAGATEALKKKNGDVAVWVGEGSGPGNDALASLGARPILGLENLLSPPGSHGSTEQLAFG
jgi:predicted Rossmann fold nucleotide-binding protein DprA/Smf involved in DNA uptake